MTKIRKATIIMLLCLCFILCSLSCTQNDSTAEPSPRPSYQYQTMPEMPDFESMQEALDALESGLKDAINQVESTHVYVISYSTELRYNDSVGTEWQCGILYNDEYISSSSQIVITDSPTEIELVAFATEFDDWTDYGSTLVVFDALNIGQQQSMWATVIVTENNGRYTGNTAEWYLEITIERIS